MKTKAKTVTEYIALAPPVAKKHLREIRAILKKAAPRATETLKWGMPMYEEKRILFAFGAFKSHLNFMPTPAVVKAFEEALAAYTTGKGSIQFPYDQPLPKALIGKMARLRVKELRERDARWM